ncbi:MAG: DUF503 domain-containing protein [Pseudomonadota bacterium]|nr:DUF503 domain-containing protein [Pseudomonadota bacterium]
MIVGVGMAELWLPECRSLKEKRSVLTKLIKRTRNAFNVSIAEVGDNDSWKRARVGFSVVGSDRRHINAKIDHIFNYMEGMEIAQVIGANLEITSYSSWVEEQAGRRGTAEKYDDF